MLARSAARRALTSVGNEYISILGLLHSVVASSYLEQYKKQGSYSLLSTQILVCSLPVDQSSTYHTSTFELLNHDL